MSFRKHFGTKMHTAVDFHYSDRKNVYNVKMYDFYKNYV